MIHWRSNQVAKPYAADERWPVTRLHSWFSFKPLIGHISLEVDGKQSSHWRKPVTTHAAVKVQAQFSCFLPLASLQEFYGWNFLQNGKKCSVMIHRIYICRHSGCMKQTGLPIQRDEICLGGLGGRYEWAFMKQQFHQYISLKCEADGCKMLARTKISQDRRRRRRPWNREFHLITERMILCCGSFASSWDGFSVSSFSYKCQHLAASLN